MNIDSLLKDPEMEYLKLDENHYKAEKELVVQYKLFVGQILRLSLAGIAVFGFLYREIFQCSTAAYIDVAQTLSVVGIVMFGIGAVSALAFLYLATEGLRYYIAGLRYYEKTQIFNNTELAKACLKKRFNRIRWCRLFKLLASFMLGFGGLSMGGAIIMMLS